MDWRVVTHAFNPSSRDRGEQILSTEASLGYILSSRPAVQNCETYQKPEQDLRNGSVVKSHSS